MKNFCKLLFCFSFFYSSLSAQYFDQCEPQCEPSCETECAPSWGSSCFQGWFDNLNLCSDWGVEFRVAWFSPTNKNFRKIYSDNLVDYQIELSKHICGNWEAWIDVDYMSKKGHSSYFHNPTRITIVPVGFGLNYHFCVYPCTDLYVGAGVDCTYLHIRDHSPYVHQHISKTNVGGTFKLGLKHYFWERFFAEVFADYFVQYFDFHNKHSGSSSSYVERRNANLSGVKVGGGIGITF